MEEPNTESKRWLKQKTNANVDGYIHFRQMNFVESVFSQLELICLMALPFKLISYRRLQVNPNANDCERGHKSARFAFLIHENIFSETGLGWRSHWWRFFEWMIGGIIKMWLESSAENAPKLLRTAWIALQRYPNGNGVKTDRLADWLEHSSSLFSSFSGT